MRSLPKGRWQDHGEACQPSQQRRWLMHLTPWNPWAMSKDMDNQRARLCVLPLMLGACLSLAPREAHAEPQGTVGLTIGAAGRALEHRYWDQTVFHLGLRGDVLFGRSKVTDFGAGPYLEVATHAFDEVQLGGGISTLLPITQALPLVLSAGAYGRYAPLQGLEPGVSGALFFGSRSYNYHANYVMAAGLLAQFRYGLGASGETSIVIGAQLDLVALSLPFQLLINAIRGGGPDTRPVR